MATQTAIELQPLDQDEISTPLRLQLETQAPLQGSEEQNAPTTLSTSRSVIVIAQLAGVNLITSFSNGLITVALPVIAADIALKPNLLVWPTSVVALSSGACLLVAGSVADMVGSRSVNLAGSFLQACFILACGLSQTGLSLIMMRALQGVAYAMVVPTAISLISTSVAQGRPRNIGFGCLGMSDTVGFALGLVLSGVFVDTIGWRAGFYVASAMCFVMLSIGFWALPSSHQEGSVAVKVEKVIKEIDWVGAILASGAISLFSYVLAMLSSNLDNIHRPSNIALLCFSMALVPAFGFWVHRQESQAKPAFIPNSIWKTTAFTSVCIMLLFSFAVVTSMELFCSLFFQEVQDTTALGASLRLLPSLIVGSVLNLSTGTLIHKIPATYTLILSSILCAGAPLLMAVINPGWPYWYDAFFAQILAPMSVDILFTVGLLVVSDSFPEKTQALAGAVFNTVAALGASIGLTTLSVISASVTKNSKGSDKTTKQALMDGYRASFWTLFAMMIVVCGVGGVGLKKLGKIGQKRD